MVAEKFHECGFAGSGFTGNPEDIVPIGKPLKKIFFVGQSI